jgi:hypothetical protein
MSWAGLKQSTEPMAEKRMFPLDAHHRFFGGGRLPDAYEADGMRVAFNADFRPWLVYEYIRNDQDEMRGDEAMAVICNLCVKETSAKPLPSAEFIFYALSWFHSRGNIERVQRLDPPEAAQEQMKKQPRLYCTFWDFDAVYDSFKQQYEIDLYACGVMHWWEFQRLLHGLKADTPLGILKQTRSLQEFQIKEAHEYDEVNKIEAKRLRTQSRVDKSHRWSLLVGERFFTGIPERW